MISKDKKYCTRDGREVRIYATDGGPSLDRIHGAVKIEGAGWTPATWAWDGSSGGRGVEFDLCAMTEAKQYTKAEEDLYKALGDLPINNTFRHSASINVVLAIRAMIDEALLKDKAVSVNNARPLLKDDKENVE